MGFDSIAAIDPSLWINQGQMDQSRPNSTGKPTSTTIPPIQSADPHTHSSTDPSQRVHHLFTDSRMTPPSTSIFSSCPYLRTKSVQPLPTLESTENQLVTMHPPRIWVQPARRISFETQIKDIDGLIFSYMSRKEIQ